MRLEQYLYERGESQKAFAARAGVQQSAVSRLCNGGDVRGKVWARITTATGGKVTPKDHFAASRVTAA